MSNGTVGVAQSAAPDRLIDNEVLSVGGDTVYRQRVSVVPASASIYFAGVSGSVNVPSTHAVVAVSCFCTSAGSLEVGGGDAITVPAGCGFTDSFADAPIVGTGAGSVVFTGTATYYVRAVPVVS